MSITVAQLCELATFKHGFQLVAGQDGLSNEVQHVTVMEVPDFADFDLGSQLFVLTTLYAFSNSTENAVSIVKQLCKKNIAAIGVKVNRFLDAIPPEIIQIADENHLPLFTVAKDIAFREVISDISTEIIDSQLKTIKALNSQHELLMTSVLRGDKIQNFVNVLGDHLHCYCACISASKTVLAQYSVPAGQKQNDELDSVIDQIMDISINGTPTHTVVGDYLVFPCYVYNQTMGFLILKPAAPLSNHELLLTQQLVSFLSIKFLEQHLRVETEQRMITAIVDQILFHHYTDVSIIQERVRLLGLVPQKFHCVVIFSSREENLKNTIQLTLHHWSTELNSLFPKSAVFLKGTELIVIISLADNSPFLQEGAIRRALVKLMDAKHIKEENHFDFGYSNLVTDLRLLPECYEQANKAIQFGRAFKPHFRVFYYGEFIEMGLLSHSVDTPEYRLMLNRILTPLQKYDEKYNAALWETLEKCLFTKSLEQAAQELHIHSSTLRYRLQRIKDITGVDFFSHNGYFLLNLAYVLSKI